MLKKSCLLTLAACLAGWLLLTSTQAQTEVTGALQGSVYDEAHTTGQFCRTRFGIAH